MSNKTLGEMTPAERAKVIHEAAQKFQAELDRSAPYIAAAICEGNHSVYERCMRCDDRV